MADENYFSNDYARVAKRKKTKAYVLAMIGENATPTIQTAGLT